MNARVSSRSSGNEQSDEAEDAEEVDDIDEVDDKRRPSNQNENYFLNRQKGSPGRAHSKYIISFVLGGVVDL